MRIEGLEHGEQNHRDDQPEQQVFRHFIHARFSPDCPPRTFRPTANAYTSRERAREALGLRIVTRVKSARKLRMYSSKPVPWNSLIRNDPPGFSHWRLKSSASSAKSIARIWSARATPLI